MSQSIFPTLITNTFIPSLWSFPSGQITAEYLNSNFLKFPIAQGSETIPANLSVTGTTDLGLTNINNNSLIITDGTTTNTINKTGYTTKNSFQNSTHYINFSDSSATGIGAIQKSSSLSVNPATGTLTTAGLITATGGVTTPANIVTTGIGTMTSAGLITATGGVTTPANIVTTGSGTMTSAGLITANGGVTATDVRINNTKIHLGQDAGLTTQGATTVAIGNDAGKTTQGDNAVAIGLRVGTTSQGVSAVAIGVDAGNSSQGQSSIGIGVEAGNSSQGTKSVAIGFQAGKTSQSYDSIAIGSEAGLTSQGNNCIALGANAGKTSQGNNSIAIGVSSAGTGTSSVAIGESASTSTFNSSVAIGDGALSTANNQIRLGTVSENVSVPGTITSAGLITANGGISATSITTTSNTDFLCKVSNRQNIEFGANVASNLSLIDFHANSSFDKDYDARIIVSGATTDVIGTALMSIESGGLTSTGKITASAGIKYGNSPMVAYKFSGAGSQTIANLSDTIVKFPDADTRNGTLTGITYVPATGIFTNSNAYAVTLTVNVNVAFANNTTGFRVLWLNTSVQGRIALNTFNGVTTDPTCISLSCTFVLNASETFEIRTYQTSGGDLNIGGNNTQFPNRVSVLVM